MKQAPWFYAKGLGQSGLQAGRGRVSSARSGAGFVFIPFPAGRPEWSQIVERPNEHDDMKFFRGKHAAHARAAPFLAPDRRMHVANVHVVAGIGRRRIFGIVCQVARSSSCRESKASGGSPRSCFSESTLRD